MKQKTGSIVNIMESGQRNLFLWNQEQLHLSIIVRNIFSGKLTKSGPKVTHWLTSILGIILSTYFKQWKFRRSEILKMGSNILWNYICFNVSRPDSLIVQDFDKLIFIYRQKILYVGQLKNLWRHPSFLWCWSPSWSTFNLNRSYVEGFRLVSKLKPRVWDSNVDWRKIIISKLFTASFIFILVVFLIPYGIVTTALLYPNELVRISSTST